MEKNLTSELEHYGVQGMKWGVRKDRTPSGKSSRFKKAVSKYKKDRQIKSDRRKAKKNRRRISDKELNARIDRLQREKKLKDLTNEDVDAGRKFVSDILDKVGKAAAAGVTTYGMYAAVKYGPSLYSTAKKSGVGEAAKEYVKNIDWQQLANYAFANPNKKK